MSYDYGIDVQFLRFTKNRNGVYAIGQVNCNPITGETYYWSKVGLSSDMYQRLRTYLKHAPMTYIANVMFIKSDNCSNYSRSQQLDTKSYELREKVCDLFHFNKITPRSSFTDIMEGVCHYILNKISLDKGIESTEWFQLSKEDYLAFCDSFDTFIYNHCTEEQLDALRALADYEEQPCFTYYDLDEELMQVLEEW